MAIVYQHRLPNKGDVFYIGIGKAKKRAFSKSNRNKFWHNVVNKYGYEVEVLVENISWEVACKIEKELIEKYGRRCTDQGPLVNMTEGGEGVSGYTHTQETKIRMSKNRNIESSLRNLQKAKEVNTGKRKLDEFETRYIHQTLNKFGWIKGATMLGASFRTVKTYCDEKQITPEPSLKSNTSRKNLHRASVKNKNKRKIEDAHTLQEIIELYEEYTIEEISKKLGVSFPTVSSYLKEKGIYIPRKNMKPLSAEKRQKISKNLKGKGSKEVIQYSKNGEFINKFKSLTEASNKTSVHSSCISAVCNGKQKTAGGFKWKFISYKN